jgi:PAS domain S-box-containing protein
MIDPGKFNLRPGQPVLVVLGYLALFVLLDRAAVSFETMAGVSLWYPPAGLNLALLLIFGIRYAPAIPLAFSVSGFWLKASPFPPSVFLILICTITAGYSLMAAILRNTLRLDLRLRRLRDVSALALVSLAGGAVVASLAVSELVATKAIQSTAYLSALVNFWLGDMVGVIILTPFLLVCALPCGQSLVARISWGKVAAKLNHDWWMTPELLGQIATILLLAWIIAGVEATENFHLFPLYFLPLTWIVLRYGLSGATVGILVTNLGSMVAFHSYGPQSAHHLIELQVFMLVFALTGLFLGAVVTKHKLADEALRQSEQRFRLVASSISDHIYVTAVTPDGGHRNLYLSPHIEALTGYPLERFSTDWTFWPSTVIHPDDRAPAAQQAVQLGQGHNSEMEYRLVRADGTLVWVRDSGRVQNEANGSKVVYGVVSDITGRKEAEAEIRRRNRELALLNRVIATSSAGLEEVETILETVCRELAQTFELPHTVALLLGEDKTTMTVVAEHAENGPTLLGQALLISAQPLLQRILTEKKPVLVHDFAEPAPLPAAALLLLPLIIAGKVTGVVSLAAPEAGRFTEDDLRLAWSVTDQVAGRLARIRLAQTRRLLTTAIEQSAESVVITNTTGTILYVNPAFERITGYSRAEAIGQNPRILQSGEHTQTFYEALWMTITSGEVWHGRLKNKRKDGTFYIEDASITPVRGEGGEIVNYVAVKRDVTHELQLEEQYHQAQKMEAIGQLAGGVAHDFNNLLTAIMGYTALALQTLPPESVARNDLQGVQKTAERAANLTRQLLAFARRQVIQPTLLNLNELIVNMSKMMGRLIGENIEIVTRAAPDLGMVRADAGQMEQVLLNLVVNARDAMPDGGKLVIETANVVLDRDYARQHSEVASGEYVMLSVSDEGMGMSHEVQARIFEPFFTTKEQGKGTGLGLATCFGIVKQNGGQIWVYSEEGYGTSFKVYLPRLKQTQMPTAPSDKPETLPPGKGRILLVEDEPVVRELARRTLHEQGYKVLTASNGIEAMRLLEGQAAARIDLLLTDVIMPKMGGRELAERLTALRAEVKVLFMSGYTDDAVIQHAILEHGAAFLQKPFSPAALLNKVYAVLHEMPEGAR